MSLTDSVALTRWIAAGVRHEVLLRSLPSLRHDMAAPVSVLRMAILLLKRQLAAASIDAEACAHRITVLDQQMGGLVEAIRLLRGWETSAASGTDAARDTITRPALVAKCVALLRPVFDLRGVSISLAPLLEAQPPGAGSAGAAANEPSALPPEPVWPNGVALRYLLLASLCCLHDAPADAGTVHIAPDGPDGLELRSLPRTADMQPPMCDPMASGGRLEIDAAALQCLADDLGYAVIVTADGVRLRLAAA